VGVVRPAIRFSSVDLPQPHEFALGHGQVDVAQRGEQALAGLEGLLDAGDFDELGGQ
jgi:hypothetical protein